jgi:RNA polymerase sigma-70 factor (ECF subfamily)
MTHVWSASLGDAVRTRDVYAEIRQALDADDQILLALRVDRDLSWREIAHVLVGEDAAEDEVVRKAAALRKQFERVVDQLRELAADRLDS